MEMHHDPLDQPARDAASLVMLRDGQAGLEVFLHQRHAESDVLGGAYVFPGGKLDSEDELTAAKHLRADPKALHDALGEPHLTPAGAAAIFTAALREAFEESGALYASPLTQTLLDQARELHRLGMGFDELLGRLGLQLDPQPLVPWSRWITPRVGGVVRKRFDTRFFLARPPVDQTPGHDNHEAVHSLWLRPIDALRQHEAGTIEMAPPQIMGLVHLACHRTVDSAWAEAQSRLPPTVQPEAFVEHGVRMVCYPGDARHSVAQRALPGPTRLVWREGRFESPPGFGSLLDQVTDA